MNRISNIVNVNVHVVYREKTHKFIIVDFEFTMIKKTSMVLISGEISNSLDRYKIRKLER